ncbi:uncharacterized protein RCC_08718 [Ramularia collo-cygni]|uniref:Uncharacterized protein n=1 Tax=Ramularia collo-cygni TaxID=112498 RepID=A0A2D3VMW8_9PEZI|nr:uncharacterized protein RCC_08718 [Ramularia collo-cygni]CZT23008.1 uncharacterized protein RCC_08718 [Ramularia collo-cygni]
MGQAQATNPLQLRPINAILVTAGPQDKAELSKIVLPSQVLGNLTWLSAASVSPSGLVVKMAQHPRDTASKIENEFIHTLQLDTNDHSVSFGQPALVSRSHRPFLGNWFVCYADIGSGDLSPVELRKFHDIQLRLASRNNLQCVLVLPGPVHDAKAHLLPFNIDMGDPAMQSGWTDSTITSKYGMGLEVRSASASEFDQENQWIRLLFMDHNNLNTFGFRPLTTRFGKLIVARIGHRPLTCLHAHFMTTSLKSAFEAGRELIDTNLFHGIHISI